MRSDPKCLRRRTLGLCCTVALGLVLVVPALPGAQERGNPEGEWRYQSGDAWGTRYSSLDQIDASNFGDLEVQWIWRGDNFSPHPLYLSRSTPSYIDGVLYTVAGYRRTVAAIDPATGETLWIYREPNTKRWEESMRASYGKGVAYTEVDGRGVIYVIHAGVLSPCARCKNREAPRRLRQAGTHPGLPAHGCHRPPCGSRV